MERKIQSLLAQYDKQILQLANKNSKLQVKLEVASDMLKSLEEEFKGTVAQEDLTLQLRDELKDEKLVSLELERELERARTDQLLEQRNFRLTLVEMLSKDNPDEVAPNVSSTPDQEESMGQSGSEEDRVQTEADAEAVADEESGEDDSEDAEPVAAA